MNSQTELCPNTLKMLNSLVSPGDLIAGNFALRSKGNCQSHYTHPMFSRDDREKCLEMKPKPQIAYKKKAKVLIFAMCDDLNGVARCGIESVALNTYINTHIELKKLRFHVPDKKGKSKCELTAVTKILGAEGSECSWV